MDDDEEMQTETAKKLAAEEKAAKEKADREAEERKQSIYKTLMRRANIENRRKHLSHLADLEASQREPTGRVSRKIYHDLVSVRKFDQRAGRALDLRRPRARGAFAALLGTTGRSRRSSPTRSS